jgi:hypothetical protein
MRCTSSLLGAEYSKKPGSIEAAGPAADMKKDFGGENNLTSLFNKKNVGSGSGVVLFENTEF